MDQSWEKILRPEAFRPHLSMSLALITPNISIVEMWKGLFFVLPVDKSLINQGGPLNLS